MGYTWEIEVWERIDKGSYYTYGYKQFWYGDSFLSAVWNFLKAKRAGYGCITLHWR